MSSLLPVVRPRGERSLLDVLERVATAFPDHEAYVDGATRVTYQDFAARSVGAAERLEDLGVKAGDVVAICLPACVEYAIAYLGVLRLGAMATGLNPRLGRREVDAIMAKATPAAVVVNGDARHVAPALTREDIAAAPRGDLGWRPADVDADTPAAIVWTSGTSGLPKGAIFDHSNLEALSRATGELSAPFDRRLSSVPFAHVGYMTRVWDELGNAMTSIIVPTPWTATTALDLMEAERITVGQGVPTQWELILRQPSLEQRDLSHLRLISTGAAKVPASLVFELQRTFHVPVVVRYASTEASVIAGTLKSDPPEVIEATVGGPCPTVEIRITDDAGEEVATGEVGMIEVRSGAVMKGYFRHEGDSPLREDGWLVTGDAGSMDADGRVHLVGRRSEMYIRGGYNVYPLEVELVIVEHPSVREVAIAGVPDEVMGSRGVAWVVPADLSEPPELSTIRSWVKENLADYKSPDRLVITDSLPRNQMGKVDKKALLSTL